MSITPKYLTEKLCAEAVGVALKVARDMFPGVKIKLKAEGCFVAVLAPCRLIGSECRVGYDHVYLGEYGDRAKWRHLYDQIAYNKANQLVHGQNWDGNMLPVPHLIFGSDTVFVGGAKRQGLVVACSAFAEHVDMFVSNLVIDILVAKCQESFLKDRAKAKE